MLNIIKNVFSGISTKIPTSLLTNNWASISNTFVSLPKLPDLHLKHTDSSASSTFDYSLLDSFLLPKSGLQSSIVTPLLSKFFPRIDDITMNLAGGNDAYTGASWIDIVSGGTGNDKIRGMAGNDRLSGDAGNDVVDGGAGDDVIDGGAGADTLSGGAGADRFVFELGDSTTAVMDTITGFDTRDVIDLRTIDASAVASGNQAFSFIGTGDFSGKAGEVRYEVKNGATYVYANTDGDAEPEFALKLTGSQTLSASDFLL